MAKSLNASRTLLSSLTARTSKPQLIRQCTRAYTRQAARCVQQGSRSRMEGGSLGTGLAGGRVLAGGYGSANASVRGSGNGSVRGYKTVQEAKSRYKSGPFSALAGVLFLASGAGLIFYFRYEKARMERKRVAEAAKGVGRPKVGGPFQLLDQKGEVWGDEKMRGRYSLVYFGFSHCPDICPEELDKMAQMIDLVNASPLLSASSSSADSKALPPLLPIFITCDPARDTPSVLSTYLSEFHPAIVGLTGTWEQIKDVCKKYRVYFSTPAGVKQGEDYLVDHSIYFYLMDPEGDFVEAIGRQHSPESAAEIILAHVGDWGKAKR
ncbi:probable Sco1 protein [Rhynchosporium graminicola]|uniref:Probable Sco1 protein n=1 Tax=Rhynchosporium graminicola TaxID=2792576 RepID=A0A1E1KUY0_9HELO|nr:probable Sco1 protein [Rhynchosporium commune]